MAKVFGNPDPNAILRAAGDLPYSKINSLLNAAPSQHLNQHILHVSRLIELTGNLINSVENWDVAWESLGSLQAVTDLSTQCKLVRAQIDAFDVDSLKSVVLGLPNHSQDVEALLTALTLRLIPLLAELESLLLRAENRADISRLEISLRHEISAVDWFTPELTRTKISKAGQILDEILDIAAEPIPESWIDEVENLEKAMMRGDWTQDSIIKSSSTMPSITKLSEKRSSLKILQKKSADGIDNTADDRSRAAESRRRQKAMEIEELRSNDALQKLRDDGQANGSTGREPVGKPEGTLAEQRDELRNQLKTQHERLSQPRAIRPASIASLEEGSSVDDDLSTSLTTSDTSAADSRLSSDTTQGIEHQTPVKKLESTATTQPLAGDPQKSAQSDSPYTPSHFGHAARPRPSFPMGTLETTERGLVLDIERVAAIAAERMSPSPPNTAMSDSMTRSPSVRLPIDRFLESAAAAIAADDYDESIMPSPEIDLSVVDDESPMQIRHRKEQELKVLEKDLYKSRSISHGHTPTSSIGSAELAPNDPKRLSVDVASLRSTLSSSAGTPEKMDKQTIEKQTLDKKIQGILTSLENEHIEITPAESPEKDKNSQLGTYKLVSSTTASTLKEAGYGTTRKYILQRPNAALQVIWVRIIAERVMVRVGGGWTDLAEWLSNYILYHTATGTSTTTPDEKTSAKASGRNTPSTGRRSTSGKLQSRVASWGKSTLRDAMSPGTPTPTDAPADESSKASTPSSSSSRSLQKKASSLSLRKNRQSASNSKSSDGKKNATSNSSTTTPTPLSSSANSSTASTPLGSAGPVSSLEKNGKLSSEKKAWVHKMLRQVSSGINSSPLPSNIEGGNDPAEENLSGGDVKRRLFSS
ncbi:hypothetical protein BZA70DRAFT_311092 [Myxozyma melibiosi]|uniref:GAR domain-containing protein n=1 Tax=Myxozyma melibiosi TaxID=54550 RepID=A0ABR1F437_9ASCO